MPFAPKYNGPHFTDPREYEKSITIATGISNVVLNTYSTSDLAAFFTNVTNGGGVVDDTNCVANTYKTVVSIASGMGIVSNLIGPTGLAGTPTTTWGIAVDNAPEIEVPVVATTTGQRALLGPYINDESAGQLFTSASVLYRIKSTMNAGNNTALETNVGLTPFWFMRTFGTPCLIYRTSLVIRIKSSENNSTTTNRERRSAVMYKSFT